MSVNHKIILHPKAEEEFLKLLINLQDEAANKLLKLEIDNFKSLVMKCLI